MLPSPRAYADGEGDITEGESGDEESVVGPSETLEVDRESVLGGKVLFSQGVVNVVKRSVKLPQRSEAAGSDSDDNDDEGERNEVEDREGSLDDGIFLL